MVGVAEIEQRFEVLVHQMGLVQRQNVSIYGNGFIKNYR